MAGGLSVTRLMIVATRDGVRIFQAFGEGYEETAGGLEGRAVTSVTANKDAILAGTERGVFIWEGEGRSWRRASEGLTEPHVRWLAHRPDAPSVAFAGTEPAAIFFSSDGAETWTECSEVADLRDANGWYLPYSHEAGAVRGFAFHGSRAYAAVEQGGLLRSDDGGRSWRLAGGSTGDPHAPVLQSRIHTDVHSVAVHRSSPDLVLAPTGGGLYLSEDGGGSWSELYDCYCRAAWMDPEDSDHIILGPADGVDSNGRIEESKDNGETWHVASDGLEVPWSDHMVERFTQLGKDLLAVLSNGRLIAAPLETVAWRRILGHVDDAADIAVFDG